jgi:hypothetical protein
MDLDSIINHVASRRSAGNSENINNSHTQHTTGNLHGGGGEIATAKRSLACAKKWEQSTKVSLESALQQLKEAEKNAKDAKDQVRDAELHLRSVEKVCLKTHYV